jgi:signal peptidase II
MNGFVRLGIAAAIATLIADQASKLWLLNVFDLGTRGAVSVTPFFDLILTWNKGISYGWFQTDSELGQAVLIAVKVVAVAGLAIWLVKAPSRIAALSLGLIIGGAFGNGIDRLVYGAVMDFALLHARIGGSVFNWYVFNFADVAIVAGVIGLLYDSLRGPAAVKAP